ncbi:unnamed protein product [Mesocestoides corti]|uniref:Nitroreductase domain-containing protein n=1 Tax=Mesocestoides corti TaxID=53468 RepID=A0A0R3URA1_MESCO|nr:unnamed protein product [Mesocestoides corti]
MDETRQPRVEPIRRRVRCAIRERGGEYSQQLSIVEEAVAAHAYAPPTRHNSWSTVNAARLFLLAESLDCSTAAAVTSWCVDFLKPSGWVGEVDEVLKLRAIFSSWLAWHRTLRSSSSRRRQETSG